MNITKLKQNLRELHPLTRIIKITDLIKRTEDKKLKEELNKLLEQTNKEIEHSSIFNLGALPQQSTHIEETQRPQEFQNLEQVLIQEPIIEKEENNADTSYRSSSSDYDKGYERQRELNYEREREHREETITNKPFTFQEQSAMESKEKIRYKSLEEENGTGY